MKQFILSSRAHQGTWGEGIGRGGIIVRDDGGGKGHTFARFRKTWKHNGAELEAKQTQRWRIRIPRGTLLSLVFIWASPFKILN